MNIVIKILFCITLVGGLIYSYIEKQNELTALRLAIPALAKELNSIQEENIRIKYAIDQYETPEHLLELAQKPEFAHLKHSYKKDILFLRAAPPLPCTLDEKSSAQGFRCPDR